MIDLSYTFAGLLTGFVVGLTGVGGGALMTPILLIFFGVTPVTAIATDLWFAVITKLVGARVHHHRGSIDWQVVQRLWMGSLPSSLCVVVLVSLGASLTKVVWLNQAIGMVVLVTAVGMLLSPVLLRYASRKRIAQPVKFKSMQPFFTIISGAVLGVCVALTSIGAGALGSVMLMYLYPLRMTPHRLIATDIVHAIPLAAVAGLGYLFMGHVDTWMLVSLLLGSIPAVFLGSLLAGRVSGRTIQIALAIVLSLAGFKILV